MQCYICSETATVEVIVRHRRDGLPCILPLPMCPVHSWPFRDGEKSKCFAHGRAVEMTLHARV